MLQRNSAHHRHIDSQRPAKLYGTLQLAGDQGVLQQIRNSQLRPTTAK